jgi:hypothetical protein
MHQQHCADRQGKQRDLGAELGERAAQPQAAKVGAAQQAVRGQPGKGIAYRRDGGLARNLLKSQ